MYTQINDQNIYFQKVGKGKNLIVLHGWGNDVSSFWGVADSLKSDFTLWLIDLPGFGRSDLPHKPFTVSDYAEIIYQFIKQQKIEKPILLGHSVGGRIGIKLSSQHPNLLHKLILESSAGIRPQKDLPKLLIYPIAKASRLFLPNIFGIKEKLRLKFYKTLESDYLTAGPLKDTLTNLIYEDLTEDLQKIATLTLLIWGEDDPTDEASFVNGKKMYRLIPNSKLVSFENTGHFPHLERPERFISYVKDFC